jgi:hypothetical protein
LLLAFFRVHVASFFADQSNEMKGKEKEKNRSIESAKGQSLELFIPFQAQITLSGRSSIIKVIYC